jgi:hypothetical protein
MLHHRVLAVGTLGVALVLTGCGSKGSTKASGSTTTTVAGQPNRAAFNTCLQQHGVDPAQVPAGGRGRGGGPGNGNPADSSIPPSSAPRSTLPANVQQALQACQSLLPRGGQGGFGNGAYAQCLQQHGVTTGAPGTPPNTDDPKFQAARQACASLRPNRSTTTSTAP